MKPDLSVLIIEPDHGQAELLALMLHPTLPAGHTYHTETLPEAISILTLRTPDLIFYGFEAEQASRALEGLKQLRTIAPRSAIVVLASLHGEDVSMNVLSAGAQDYLIRERLDQETLSRSVRYAMARGEHMRMTTEFERRERLSTLGQIVAALSHQINNPASVVMSNSDMILGYVESLQKETLKNNEENKAHQCAQTQYLEDIKECAQDSVLGCAKIKTIIDEIGAYTGASAQEGESSSLHGMLQDAMLGFDAQVWVMELEEDAALWVSYPRVVQALSAIMWNAYDAVQGCKVDAMLKVCTNNYKEHVVIVVEDNGDGILPAAMPRIFEPFFSAKEKHVGLGLTLAKEVARSYGGTIHIESTPGLGTRVMLTLPKHEHAVTESSTRDCFLTPMFGHPSMDSGHLYQGRKKGIRDTRQEGSDELDMLFWESTCVDEDVRPHRGAINVVLGTQKSYKAKGM